MFNDISIKCKRKSTNQHQLRDGSHRDVKCRVWMHVECQIRWRGEPPLNIASLEPAKVLQRPYVPSWKQPFCHKSWLQHHTLLSLLLQRLEVAHSKAGPSASNKLSNYGCTVTSPGELLKTLLPGSHPQRIWRKWSGERQLTSILNKLPPTQPGLKNRQSWEPPVLEASLQNTLKQ